MLTAPRIPELKQRDRFIRRAVREGRVLTLADEEQASVPSQKFPGRIAQLFWSSPVEAKRWAEALSGSPDLQEIPLQTFAADILPGLRAAKGLAGTDWVSDPIEAEVDPGDLQLRLKAESLPLHLKAIAGRGEVFFVANDEGPALETIIRHDSEIHRLAVFASRQEAERAAKKTGTRRVVADPVADFLTSTLPWAAEHGYRIVFEPIAGAGPLESAPADVMTRLAAL